MGIYIKKINSGIGLLSWKKKVILKIEPTGKIMKSQNKLFYFEIRGEF